MLDGTAALVAPAAVRVVDLEEPLTDLLLWRAGAWEPYRTLLAVARLNGDPLGRSIFSVDPSGRVSRDRLADGLRTRLEPELREAFAAHGLALPRSFPAAGIPGLAGARRATPAPNRPVSVVVATCGGPAGLERCLRSVFDSDYGDFEVIVVENRPSASATRQMLDECFASESRLRYVEQPNRGAAWARNAGLALADGEIVAFTDDDVIVDPEWIRRCACALERGDDVACITGLILPLGLETDSQLLLEQFAGFGKGFRRQTFRLPEARDADPLFPYTAGSIGSGASTVVRASVARQHGGFDTTLGPGTPAAGAEDLDLYVRLLRAGCAVTYEPSAIVWHQHPDGMRRLRSQVFRYGVGLGAMLGKQLFVGPARAELLRAVPRGVRYARDPTSRKNAGKPPDYPHRFDWLERLGMLLGPVAYLLSAALAAIRRLRRGAAVVLRPPVVERLVLATGKTMAVVSFEQREVAWPRPRARRRRAAGAVASPGRRAVARPGRLAVAAAAVASAAAPLFVALDLPVAVRLPVVLTFLCIAPGTALLIVLRGRLEAGLVVGASLGSTAVVAQSMLWLGVWWPKTFLYALAFVCLAPLISYLDVARRSRSARASSVAGSAPARALVRTELRRERAPDRARPGALASVPRLISDLDVAGRSRAVWASSVAALAPARALRTERSPDRSRLGARPSAVGESAQPVAVHATLLALALTAWGASLIGANLSRIGGVGLLNAMPPTYLIAVALLLCGFTIAVTSGKLTPKLLGLYVLTLVLVLHGTTPLLYAEPRYAWLYKHIGVIELIMGSGRVDRSIDVYNNWPAFFAANAWFSRTAGLAPIDYAGWAQLFFNIANVAAVRFAVRGLTRDERLLWTTALFFVVGNWVAQDYLAPQAFGFLLSLVIIGLCLRCSPVAPKPRAGLDRWVARSLKRFPGIAAERRAPDDDRPASPLTPAAATVVGGVCFLAVVTSHQLSPLLLILSVAALWLLAGLVPLWIPLAMAVIEVAWVALAWPFVGAHFSVLDPGSAGAAAAGRNLHATLPGATLSFYAPGAIVALIAVLALIGAVERFRMGKRDVVLACLIFAPLFGAGIQSYGGEGPNRAYLFALPWLAFFAAAACARASKRRAPVRIRGGRLIVATSAVGACLLFAYFGQELANHISPDDVAAAAWYERHAPAGSVRIDVAPNAPNRLTARYPLVSLADPPALLEQPGFAGHQLGAGDVPRLERLIRQLSPHPTFIVMSRGQENYGRLNGLLPAGSVTGFARALDASPAFRLVYRRPTAWVFEYRRGPQR